jgi:hypothetical protein
MKWTKERDLFIAQTMAFVQSITRKEPETETRAAETWAAEARAEVRIEFTRIDEIEKVERPIEIVQMIRPLPIPRGDVREEIQGRVAAFRAHQQLFHREREAYFNSVLAKLRASTESRPKAPGS